MKLLILSIYSVLFAPPWSSLTNGPHAVGYQVLNRYDYGRTIIPPTNFEGKKNSGERALPIQISMWYPTGSAGVNKMKFQDYVYITRERNDFKTLTEEQKIQSFDVLRFPAQFGAGIQLTDDQVKTIYSQSQLATKDAPIKNGRFPVIIVASDGGPSNHPALYEHLASIGYIVLFSPGINRDGSRQVNSPQHVIMDRINNIEYLLSFARSVPAADLERIGVMGINFDGMTALLYQMKSGEARAVVSIDGWEGKTGSEQTLQNSIYYNPTALKAPYFVVLQDEKNPQQWLTLSENVYNSMLYADRYYYVFKNMDHSYLMAGLYAVPQIPDENKQSYNYLYTTIGKFFDAYVKDDAAAKQFVMKSSKENGLPDLVKKELKKPGLPPVPSALELETMIMAGEIDKVKSIAKEALKGNPGLKFLDFGALNLYNFRFSRNNKPELSVAVRELGVQLFPASAEAMDLLGDAQAAFNKTNEAKKSYQQALTLIDDDTALNADEKQELRKSISEKIK
ncbi:MAG TPA: hypothetical protein VFE50_16270 [Cyclobacteriaceae bacterium]|nr:hypothetical protein [Cyclobacteriaceae bacterium]